jgi:diaminobutyrate-2-oxoglutarate transaminase
LNAFERLESQVRSYCGSFLLVFETTEGTHLTDVEGGRYIDSFAAAGALNYGHNHPAMKQAIVG